MSTESLKAIAESRFDHALHRKNLKERIEGQLIVAHNGGLFKAKPELITFLALYTNQTDVCIEDMYGMPILVDAAQLLKELQEAYQFAMNAWYTEYHSTDKIRKNKNV
jgi:hypothetical protein